MQGKGSTMYTLVVYTHGASECKHGTYGKKCYETSHGKVHWDGRLEIAPATTTIIATSIISFMQEEATIKTWTAEQGPQARISVCQQMWPVVKWSMLLILMRNLTCWLQLGVGHRCMPQLRTQQPQPPEGTLWLLLDIPSNPVACISITSVMQGMV